MTITTEEFENGTVNERDHSAVTDDQEDPIETEKNLILSFLSDRPNKAFTERQIVLGVDFSPVLMDRTQSPLGSLADGIIDFAGDVTATTIVINDVDQALTELVEEGVVEAKEIDTADGPAVYYQLVQ